MGPQSQKIEILGKYKMAAGDQIVHLTKIFFLIKKFHLNVFDLECGKIFDLRLNPEALEPKN